VTGQTSIPLDVRVFVCVDCGAVSTSGKDVEPCQPSGHRFSHVHYEISAQQNDAIAQERVADLQKHGRRLLADAPE
jgi:hypothetical protein